VLSPTLCWCNVRQATTGGILGQALHGCARTTAAVRRALQHSQKSLNGLAEQYGSPSGRSGLCQRCPDGAEESPVNGSDEGRRSRRCRFPQIHAAAAGRLPVCLAAKHPASDAFILTAYNFAKRLKTLKGPTPFEYIRKIWTTQPNASR
jgi:hypothetical protein